MERRTRSAALAIALLVIGGSFAWRCQKTPRTGTIVNPFAPARMEVSLAGEPVASFTTPEAALTVRIARHETSDEGLDPYRHRDFVVRVDSPCGMQRLGPLDARPARRDAGAPDPFQIDVSAITHDGMVSVDNRAGPARRLTLGSLDIPVPAGQVLRQKIYVPEMCGSSARVMIDGVDLGTTPLRGHTFVEPTGRRCYLLRKVKYGMPIFAGDPEPPARLAPAKVRRLLVTTSVLERAPDTVKTIGIIDEREELMDEACSD